jgi:Xaa-Pro dipeptidase
MSLSAIDFGNESPERLSDITQKHRLISEFLKNHHYDALLLQKPENFAWLTSGADCTRGGSESSASLFITPDVRVVVTNNIDAVQFFERDLAGLGFQLKQRAWHDSQHALVEDLCRGRTVASDTGIDRTNNISVHLTGMRLPLSELECLRARRLGRRMAHAVEATARHCQQGQTEAEIAGEVAHRLMKHLAVPVRIQVMGDGRGERFRHWGYSEKPVRKYCTISAVGRRDGLCVGISRTFSFGEAPAALRGTHSRAMLMQATGMYFSQSDWELFEVWKRVKRIYEKFGFADEWQNARQAEIVGYELTEIPVVPKSEFRLLPGMMVYWHPSVEMAAGGDTILVHEKGFELLTPAENWPTVAVNVKGKTIHCPGVLERESLTTAMKHGEREHSDQLSMERLPDDAESETDLNILVVE